MGLGRKVSRVGRKQMGPAQARKSKSRVVTAGGLCRAWLNRDLVKGSRENRRGSECDTFGKMFS